MSKTFNITATEDNSRGYWRMEFVRSNGKALGYMQMRFGPRRNVQEAPYLVHSYSTERNAFVFDAQQATEWLNLMEKPGTLASGRKTLQRLKRALFDITASKPRLIRHHFYN